MQPIVADPRRRDLNAEAKRWRLRVRLLESVLVNKAIAAEALSRGLSYRVFPEISTVDVTVDENGAVRGAERAVRDFMLSKRPAQLHAS